MRVGSVGLTCGCEWRLACGFQWGVALVPVVSSGLWLRVACDFGWLVACGCVWRLAGGL